ncbi:MAG TPA: NAD-binding protein [Candidatus Eisenbacteria bacterium]|nr:NAD-binding protein [Candidatus Eisenbacteria bacterium]
MPDPARNTLAIVGAGPIGLEAAAAALEQGLDVHVFERGEVGAHPLAWGHVAMFTPWRMNVGPATARRLAVRGVKLPEPDALPTGAELVERVLRPLAEDPALEGRVHAHAEVVQISRRGARKTELIGDPRRRERPFRLLVRDAGGRENLLHAFAVVDASGTYATPNHAGTGGMPARGEQYLAPQLSYHVDDVRGLRRERHAGRRTLVIGGGDSAITTVAALAALAAEAPGTSVAWVTRRAVPAFAVELANDALPARAALHAAGRRLIGGADPNVTWTGGAEVEGFEFNSATHRYRVALVVNGEPRLEEADQVIVNCGYGPDESLYRELQIHQCYASLGPMKLSAAILGAGTSDCTEVPAFGVEQLRNPEPDFWIVGAKSYGRWNSFLLETGYRQVADVVAQIAKEQAESAPTG